MEPWRDFDLSSNPWGSRRSSAVSPERNSRSPVVRTAVENNQDDVDRQQSLSPTEYNTESNDYFYDFNPRAPQRAATTPHLPHYRAGHRVRNEGDRFTAQGQRRQSTHDTKNSATFEQTAPWDQKTILSLDGGGIRGYSALLIIKELMSVIKRLEINHTDGAAPSSYHPESPAPMFAMDSRGEGQPETTGQNHASAHWLPCHYFDYMAGTSTGGLISIMLGRLRMNIDDCISDYETLGGKVFGHSRWVHVRSLLWYPRDKYNHKNVENVIKDVVDHRVPKIHKFPGGQNFAFDENRCRSVVLSYQQQTNEEAKQAGVERVYLFRTYKNLHQSETTQDQLTDRNPGPAHDIPIWWVARATSAAPGYFKPMKIHKLAYLDGGFGTNNPCEEIFEEVRKMNNHADDCVSLLVSIGTGLDKEWGRFKKLGPSRFINFLNVARKWASESQEAHVRMVSRSHGARFKYVRLNVEDGIGPMKLDEWRVRGPVRRYIGSCIAKIRRSRGAPQTKSNQQAQMQNGRATAEKTDSDSTVDTVPVTAKQNDRTTMEGRDASDEPNTVPRTDSPAIPKWLQPKNKTLKSIRHHTAAYLRQPDVQRSIEEVAEMLVNGRRARVSADRDKWAKACFGTWYQCKISKCPRGEKEYDDRHSLEKHFLDKHRDLFNRDDMAVLDRALDECKIVVH